MLVYCKTRFFTAMLLLQFTLLAGCNLSDEAVELGNGYLYVNEGSTAKYIFSDNPPYGDIGGKVLDYDYNSEFIVAVQAPSIQEYRNMVAFDLRGNRQEYPTNSTSDRLKSEHIADSIIKHDPYYQSVFAHKQNYWIVSHRLGKTFGPLQKQEYLNLRQKLGVPESVALDEE